MARVINDVAPMFAQGLTQQTIANRLGISQSQVREDCKLVREIWGRNYLEDEVEAVRGEAIAKADYVYSQSMEAWAISKSQGAPVGKFLDTALAAIREKVKLSGAEVDLKLIQQNVNITMASAEQVVDTFQPMDAADFKAFAAAHAEAQLKASEAARAMMPASVDTGALDVVETPDQDWISESDASEPTAKPKNKRVQHPFR